MVRAYIVLMSVAHIDWELLYTYAIIAAAFTTYPLSGQDVRAYYVLVTPVVYGPFHERICAMFPWLGITEEDWVNNKPSDKNIHKVTVTLRGSIIDKDYKTKIKSMKSHQATFGKNDRANNENSVTEASDSRYFASTPFSLFPPPQSTSDSQCFGPSQFGVREEEHEKIVDEQMIEIEV